MVDQQDTEAFQGRRISSGAASWRYGFLVGKTIYRLVDSRYRNVSADQSYDVQVWRKRWFGLFGREQWQRLDGVTISVAGDNASIAFPMGDVNESLYVEMLNQAKIHLGLTVPTEKANQ